VTVRLARADSQVTSEPGGPLAGADRACREVIVRGALLVPEYRDCRRVGIGQRALPRKQQRPEQKSHGTGHQRGGENPEKGHQREGRDGRDQRIIRPVESDRRSWPYRRSTVSAEASAIIFSRGRTMSKQIPDQDIREASLEYHRAHPPGKISILPTKQLTNQRDLALAYTPGVAAACDEIVRDPAEARNLTARGNLIGVITNGTAVLGLGAIGPLAGKPVMEGKSVLFKKFAGIDCFDIEIDEVPVAKGGARTRARPDRGASRRPPANPPRPPPRSRARRGRSPP